MRQKFCGDTLTRIAYDDLILGRTSFKQDAYLSAGWSEFHGVREYVPNDLLQPIGIA